MLNAVDGKPQKHAPVDVVRPSLGKWKIDAIPNECAELLSTLQPYIISLQKHVLSRNERRPCRKRATTGSEWRARWCKPRDCIANNRRFPTALTLAPDLHHYPAFYSAINPSGQHIYQADNLCAGH